MGSLFAVSGSGLFLNRENISKIHAGEKRFLQTYRAIDCSLLTSRCNSVSFTSEFLASVDGSGQHAISHLKRCRLCRQALVSYFFPGFQGCCRSQHGLDRPAFTANNSGGGASMEKDRNNFAKRKFSLRLRPRLRLLSTRLRRFSVQSILNELRNFVLKNMKRLAVSTSFVVLMGLCYLFFHLATLPSPKTVPYSDMVASLQNGLVSKVLFEEGSRRICYNTHSLQGLSEIHTLENKSSSSTVDVKNQNVAESLGRPRKEELLSALRNFLRFRSSTPEWQYSTRKIDHDESFLLCLIRDKEAAYCSAPQPVIMSLRSVVVTVLSLWIPLTPLLWLLYRQLSAANSPARKRRATTQAVRFDDVEGVDGAKVELMEIIVCLKGVTNYDKLGAKLPRGVLLIGPPGTGKTLLARAVAGEAGVPFFSVSASEFVELFVGRGAARMRDLFHVARKSAPSIIFIDELDAVGGKRGRSFNDERDQTLNQLLTEMDGFDSDMNVVVIAATNRPEALDPALCRPGRFSRKVLVEEPDEVGRRKILTVHFRGVPLEGETTTMCNFIASLTQGFVGADLANLVNEAALLAARRGGDTVTREDILEAIERAKYGINVTRPSATVISREIGKLFPWIPALLGRTEPRQDGPQGPAGYQVLS